MILTPISEIGEMLVSVENRDFLFKPSFKNIYKIGSPKEIVEIYALLYGKEIRERLPYILTKSELHQSFFWSLLNSPVFGRKILQNAILVMSCCCDDDISSLIGEWLPSKSGIKYKLGKLPPKVIINFAKNLMAHGVIGCCKLPKQEKSEKSDFSESFDVIEYISLARTHFNMSREDAENLTMTELQQLLKSQMPAENNSYGQFTEEEYDRIMAEYEKRRAA
ncbi:DUF6246 family protein [Mannheimia pernigra]|uniref:Uncharacterized protein n=1 Tax=Mannheimia pernigra TaxID=111844 RepID=A0A7H8UUL5_9PAST|nr:DUF6246 family protein [Mannheimia pernigra]QLB40794.1 hypothetical protein HV559_07880 [Mannheimia pernigra]QLB44419.1 hypothetical protein HV561_06485 [Mannheimia pernigra]